MLLALALTTYPTPLYPSYEAEYSIGPIGVTLIFSAFAAGAIIGLVMVERDRGRLSSLVLVVSAGVTATAAALMLALSDSLVGFLLARILSGIGAGAAAAVSTALILGLASSVGGNLARLWLRMAPPLALIGLATGPAVIALTVGVAKIDRASVLMATAIAAAVATGLMLLAAPADGPATGKRPPVPLPFRSGALVAFAATGVFGALTPTIVSEVSGDVGVAGLGFAASLPFAAAAVGAAWPRPLFSPPIILGIGEVILVAAVASETIVILVLAAAVAGFGAGALFRTSLMGALNATRDGDARHTAAVVLRWAYCGLSVPVIGLGLLVHFIDVTIGLGIFVAVSVLALLALHRQTRPSR